MKKIIKIVSLVLILVILNLGILANTVQALEKQKITVYTKGNFSRFLKYDGVLIKTANAVYEDGGKEHPIYCLNAELTGVGDKIASYEMTNQGKITDVGLWRIIINAYPYKSLGELGVASVDEAFTATKQAIYCYACGRDINKYEAVGDAGVRTINAMKKILSNAQNSKETIQATPAEVNGDAKWKEENENITKEYSVKSNKNISKYFVRLEGAPEGTVISNSSGVQKNEFKSSEKFKISIPIKSLKKSGNFKIKVKTQMETKPVYYAAAPSGEYQDYALTAFSFEDIDTEKTDKYVKNDTTIIIKKENGEKQKLKGAVFEISNESGKVLKTVETNEKGEVELKQVLPGKYIINEIKAPEGHELYSKKIEINVKLNEKQTITVKNNKIIVEPEKVEVEKKEKELTVEEHTKVEEHEKVEKIEKNTVIKEIRKLPVTGM